MEAFTRSGERGKYLLESWLELHDAIEAHPELRKMLFDPVTGLPTTPLLFPRIQVLLDERGEVSLLCLNVVKYSKIEEIYGWKVFDDVMRNVATALESIAGAYLRDSDIVAELMISGNSFVVVLSPPRSSLHMDEEDLQTLCRRVEARLRKELAEQLDPALFQKFGCYMGAATVKNDATVRMERLVYDGLENALEQSTGLEEADSKARQRRLSEIIDREEVRTLVMPVLRLADLHCVGYEALSRGPEGGEFERPDKLFKVAYDGDLVVKLERLCRKKAVQSATEMPDERLLFINIEPDAVADPELRGVMFTSLLADAALTPDRIVLEVTERSAIVDFAAFRSTIEYLRTLGFTLAVDDAGAGYGSLQCLAEVKPEWLKVDISLVRGVEKDDVRRQLIKSLAQFANESKVRLIAEGIETREEYEALVELGVEYGQGFLFGHPTNPFPQDITPDDLP